MSGNMLIQLYELVLEVIIWKTLRGQMQPPFGDNSDYIHWVSGHVAFWLYIFVLKLRIFWSNHCVPKRTKRTKRKEN